MRLKSILFASLAASFTLTLAHARADERGVHTLKVHSLLDDQCGVWINGTLRAHLPPMGDTGWLPANPDNINRTNVLVRCSDGGVYGTSVEALYESCEFEIDEEGGGLRTVKCC